MLTNLAAVVMDMARPPMVEVTATKTNLEEAVMDRAGDHLEEEMQMQTNLERATMVMVLLAGAVMEMAIVHMAQAVMAMVTNLEKVTMETPMARSEEETEMMTGLAEAMKKMAAGPLAEVTEMLTNSSIRSCNVVAD